MLHHVPRLRDRHFIQTFRVACSSTYAYTKRRYYKRPSWFPAPPPLTATDHLILRARRWPTVLHRRDTFPSTLQTLLPEGHLIVSRRNCQNVSGNRPRDAPHGCRKGFHFCRCPWSVGLFLCPYHHPPIFAAAGHYIAWYARARAPSHVAHPARVLGGGIVSAALLLPTSFLDRASVRVAF